MNELLRAKAEITQGRYQEALTRLERFSPVSPEDRAAKLILMGESFEGIDDNAQAFAAYREAQAVAPEIAAALLREGVLTYKTGDRAKARIQLSRYVEREAGNPEAFYYLHLCEDISDRKWAFQRRVIMLDGLNGAWSELLGSSK